MIFGEEAVTSKVNIPKSTKIRGKVHLIAVKDAKIILGENVTLRSDPFDYLGGMPFGTTLLVDRSEGEILIGDNCRLNGTYVHAKKSIKIGKNCVIGANTVITKDVPDYSVVVGTHSKIIKKYDKEKKKWVLVR